MKGLTCGSDSKESACDAGVPGFNSWVRKIPWRRKWLLTPVYLPGEFHGQKSLAGYSSWGRKELDTTEPLTLSLSYIWREKSIHNPITRCQSFWATSLYYLPYLSTEHSNTNLPPHPQPQCDLYEVLPQCRAWKDHQDIGYQDCRKYCKSSILLSDNI